MALSFAIDTAAGETPESVAKKREIAGLMAARVFSRAPQNVGEGLNAIGQALIARSMMGDADAALQAGLKGGRELYSSAYPGTPSVAAPAAAAATPSVSTPMGDTSIPAGGQEFTSAVMPLAQAASEKTGIDPRLIVAQAALETGYGKSAPGNNLFGIKSHGQPGGNVLPTTEVVNGQPVRTTDSFAAYASPADSANGYADFINKNPRYAPLKAAQGLEAQAAALGKSGYATDPNYGQKVLSIAQKLPAPQGGILADNSPSPLDNAQYPAGPVGAPTAVAGGPAAPVADDSGATLPPNAQPTGGVLPTAQAVQAATQPQINPRLLQLQQVMGDPRFAFFNKAQQTAVMTEYKQLLEQQQQANDPMRQLQMDALRAKIAKDQGKGGATEYGLNPIYGTDENGNKVIGTLGKDGSFKRIDTGGVSITTGVDKIDLGTQYAIYDKKSGNLIGYQPKNLQQAEAQKALGKAQGGMQASLPSDIQNAESTITQIDDLIKHPGLSSVVGPLDQFRPSWMMGSEGRDALARYNQLKGKAFLQAYSTLRGGGQITEVEGTKAENAMARMDRAQSEAEFTTALKDFRDAVKVGTQKLREKAGVAAPTGPITINGYKIEAVD